MLRRECHGVLAAAFATVVLACTGGCSPEYNWREIRPSEGGYQVMFPGKPSKASRDISLDGQKVNMRMSATEAGGHSFAVGLISLPEDSETWRQRALAAMQAQMARNVSAKQIASTPLPVAIIDAQGQARGRLTGARLDVTGEGRPNRLIGGFVAKGARAWQFVVVGQDPGDEEVRLFIESFRLVE